MKNEGKTFLNAGLIEKQIEKTTNKNDACQYIHIHAHSDLIYKTENERIKFLKKTDLEKFLGEYFY